MAIHNFYAASVIQEFWPPPIRGPSSLSSLPLRSSIVARIRIPTEAEFASFIVTNVSRHDITQAATQCRENSAAARLASRLAGKGVTRGGHESNFAASLRYNRAQRGRAAFLRFRRQTQITYYCYHHHHHYYYYYRQCCYVLETQNFRRVKILTKGLYSHAARYYRHVYPEHTFGSTRKSQANIIARNARGTFIFFFLFSTFTDKINLR